MLTKPFLAPLVGLSVALVVGVAGERGYMLERERTQHEERNTVISTVGQYRAALEGELNASLYLTDGLVAYVETHSKLDPTEAKTMLRILYEQGRHIRNIGLAPGNRLTYVFPEKGNEKAIGLYYPNLPAQWPAVERAISERRPRLAGPVNLVQGGSGFIYRVPVFIGSEGKYWGLLSMVLDKQSLFDKVGLAPQVAGLQLALRGKDGMGTAGETFMGDPSLFSTDAITETINTPGGAWQIAAKPLKGWVVAPRLTWFRYASWTAAVLLGAMFYYVLTSLALRLKAEQATKDTSDELNEAQRLAMLGSWTLDLRDNHLKWSPEIFHIFELSPEKFEASYEAFLNAIHPDDRDLVNNAYQDSVAQRRPYDIVHRLMFSDGRLKYVRERCETLYDEEGTPILSRGTVQDITKLQEIEEALRASEERWKFALEGAGHGVWDWNIQTGELFLSKQEMSVLGYEGEDATTTNIAVWEDRQHPDDRPIRQEAIDRYFSGLAPLYTCEFRTQGKDGLWRWILARGMVVSSTSEGAPLRMIGTHTDITERKRSEETLRGQKEFLWTILDNEPGCVKVVAADGALEQMNAAGLAMLELKSVEEVNEYGLINFVLPEYRSKFATLTKRTLEGEHGVMEFPVQGKTGTRHWLEMHAAPLRDASGKVTHLVGVSRDITARREVEQRLALSLRGADLAITDWDIPSDKLVFGDGWFKLLGYDPCELPSNSSSLIEFVNPEDIPAARIALERHLRSEAPSIEVEMRIRHKDGHWVWGLARGMAVERNADGCAIRVSGTVMDITERKQAEVVIARLSEWNELLLNSAGEGIYGVDLEGKCTFINPAAISMLGFSKDELLGSKSHDLFHHHHGDGSIFPKEACPIFHTLRDGTPRKLEDVFIRKNGELFPVHMTVTPMLEDSRIVGAEVIFQDISQRKAMEQELLRLATTDPLTGAANRRRFMEQLEMELARIKRFGKPASFLMMDIDHFKNINDSYGHAVGDQVLQHFSEWTRQRLRRIDLYGRLGGEEFGVLLPGTDLAGAMQFAEQFRKGIAETPVQTSKGEVRFTVSIGIAEFDIVDPAPESIMVRADVALYRAKEGGRNRVESS